MTKMCISLTIAGPGRTLDSAIERLLESGHDVYTTSSHTVTAYGDCPQVASDAVRDLHWHVESYNEVAMNPIDLAA